MVKNEAKVLPRSIKTVAKHISYYVISDTGSTDTTMSVIAEEFKKYSISGEILRHDWVNFGVNRQHALRGMYDALNSGRAGDCKHIFFIDADEELVVSNDDAFCALNGSVTYDIAKRHGHGVYYVPHLIRRYSYWKWRGPAHNYIQELPRTGERRQLDDAYILYHPGEGAKSHGLSVHDKYMRDAVLFVKELEKNPRDSRSMYYLCQSYKDAGEYELAIPACDRRAQLTSGWYEEAFMAAMHAAFARQHVDGYEQRDIVAAYLQASVLDERRAEPYYWLALLHNSWQQFDKCVARATQAVRTSTDTVVLFKSLPAYDWPVVLLWAQCACAAKQFELCFIVSSFVVANNEKSAKQSQASVDGLLSFPAFQFALSLRPNDAAKFEQLKTQAQSQVALPIAREEHLDTLSLLYHIVK
eukprot:CAMPEP_0168599070 /NCGR_PEP_ID=MMETSP0420-20121227/11833_1 /TAXON_ID=498008 /ORGANISM="Pessonella sp." /LENGTH=413 /DNA_ID=CAMNT_0008636627 /DNA_START=317 /DNA_END=1555 /DNA_ORIENTATION=-